jgi:hypothetical protein
VQKEQVGGDGHEAVKCVESHRKGSKKEDLAKASLFYGRQVATAGCGGAGRKQAAIVKVPTILTAESDAFGRNRLRVFGVSPEAQLYPAVIIQRGHTATKKNPKEAEVKGFDEQKAIVIDGQDPQLSQFGMVLASPRFRNLTKLWRSDLCCTGCLSCRGMLDRNAKI